MWYLATPYTRYPWGLEEAFRQACKQAALFVKAGIPVFSPIAHTHPIGLFGGVPNELDIWMKADMPFMELCQGIIVCTLPSWEISDGIRKEVEFFHSRKKPVVFMKPNTIPSIVFKPWLFKS